MLRRWLDKFRERDRDTRLKRAGAQSLVEGELSRCLSLGTCFSEADDLLSQWRGYAENGSGFAIAFDKRILLEKRLRAPMALSKIGYGGKDPEAMNAVIRRLADAFMDDAKKFQGDPNGFVSANLELSPEKFEKRREAVSSLFTIKNPAFYEEQEWRLHLFAASTDIEGLQFRTSQTGVSPYLRHSIEKDAIRGLIIGPTNRTPQHIVEAMCKSYDLEIFVDRSSASYRAQ